MRSKFEKFTLIACGAIIGVLISLNLPVFADKAEKIIYPLMSLELLLKSLAKLNLTMLSL